MQHLIDMMIDIPAVLAGVFLVCGIQSPWSAAMSSLLLIAVICVRLIRRSSVVAMYGSIFKYLQALRAWAGVGLCRLLIHT